MFKRRNPQSLLNMVKEFFWPSMGLRRSMTYLKHRLLRVADSSHRIALGLAIGFGVSFTPLLGTHFIQAGCFAFLCRGNIVAAMLGTFIGNPWTFPFFWWAGFSFGRLMFGVFGIDGAAEFPGGIGLDSLMDTLLHQPLTLFLPWMMGGYILALISVPATYFVYFYVINGAKRARDRAKARRRQRRLALKRGKSLNKSASSI